VDSIRVLILLYDVSCHGLNLQGACNKSVQMAVPREFSQAVDLIVARQGWVALVTLKYPSTVIRVMTPNSHDQLPCSKTGR
jgi:hypothetical protein